MQKIIVAMMLGLSVYWMPLAVAQESNGLPYPTCSSILAVMAGYIWPANECLYHAGGAIVFQKIEEGYILELPSNIESTNPTPVLLMTHRPFAENEILKGGFLQYIGKFAYMDTRGFPSVMPVFMARYPGETKEVGEGITKFCKKFEKSPMKTTNGVLY